MRFLAVREGLASPRFIPATHHVHYTCAVQYNQQDLDRLYDGHDVEMMNQIRVALTAEIRSLCRNGFVDAVCIVAYIFRVRGHHYLDSMRTRYSDIWQKCMHEPNDFPLDWQYFAVEAIHGIFPDVLDDFWNENRTESKCAGAIAKRWNSAPAGYSGIYALQRGVKDLAFFRQLRLPSSVFFYPADELSSETLSC